MPKPKRTRTPEEERAHALWQLRELYDHLAEIDQPFSDEEEPALKRCFTNALGALEDLQQELRQPPPPPPPPRPPRPRRPRLPSPKKLLEAEMDDLERRWKLPAPAESGAR